MSDLHHFIRGPWLYSREKSEFWLNRRGSSGPSVGHAYDLPTGFCQSSHPRSSRGSALVIVLAFVVLLTGLVLAFLANSLNNRKLSDSSANQAKVELFAQGAVDCIIADLKQEIISGSTSTNITTGSAITTIYSPRNTANIVPALVGSTGTNGLQNLVKRSARGLPFFPAGMNRASSDSSTSPSKNGRSISIARWNKPLLMAPTSTTDLTPSAAGFTPPDWIFVARDGSNPTAWDSNMVASPSNPSAVVGRYAYAIYDEGGLLDMNVAGYPSTSTPSQSRYKPALSYADLTQIPGITSAVSDAIVGWRNYATTQPTGALPSLSMSAASAMNYYNYVLSNVTGFLTTGGAATYNKQSDHMFTSRQQLINFLQNGLGLSATNQCLQYMGTFSRDVNQPSCEPDLPYRLANINGGVRPKLPGTAANPRNGVLAGGGNMAAGLDDQFNPVFLNARAQNPFTRFDGTVANPGDPLVKTRFPLSRLAWITCDGPSATLPTSDPRYNANGTVANILKYFGLTWTDNQAGTYKVWKYNHGDATRILQLWEVAALSGANAREPDFCELLQAAIAVGSLGKSFTWAKVASLPYRDDEYNFMSFSGIDLKAAQPKYQTLQIAASIIDQADIDDYPTEFTVQDANGNEVSLYGVENIPYLHRTMFAGYQRRAPGAAGPNDNGSFGLYLIPELWNPHDSAYSNPPNPAWGLTPADFQIQFKNTPLGGLGGVYRWTGAGSPGPTTTAIKYPCNTTTPSYSSMNFTASASSLRDPALVTGATIPGPMPSGTDLANALPIAIYSLTATISGNVSLTKDWPLLAEAINANLPATYVTGNTTRQRISTNVTNIQYQGNLAVWLGYVRGGVTHIYSRLDNVGVNNGISMLSSVQSAMDLNNIATGTVQCVQWGDPRSDRFPSTRTQAPCQIPNIGTTMRPDTSDGATTTVTGVSHENRQMPFNATGDMSRIQAAGWTMNPSVNYQCLGLLGRNQVNADPLNVCYKDPDGVLRGADGMYEVAGNYQGQQLALNANMGGRNYNRPIVLNRPFRTVGELGYTFRGGPWKTLDFFSSNSGDSALLDVFCINEPPPSGLSAGVINLNTRNPRVIQAVINGALKDETPLSGLSGGAVSLSSTQVAAIANADTTLTETTPFSSRGELVTKFIGNTNAFPLKPSTDPATGDNDAAIVKRRREAPVRALADVSTTRVWNLMVDVVVQTGKFPPGSTSLTNSFLVEGEKRYWVHLAIDRATCKVVDKAVELVEE